MAKKFHLKIIKHLSKHNIESRYLWLPNHLQIPYANNQKYQIKHANQLFSLSVCLPSSYSLNKSKIIKIVNILNKL